MSTNQRIRRLQMVRHAEGYLELGLPEQAIDALDRLDSQGVDSHVLYLRGEALRTLKRYTEAIVPLTEAAELEPDNFQIWLALGWCYKRTHQLRQAIHSLESALEVDPSEAIIHYNLACYWSLANNKARALEYLGHALQLDPDYRELVHREHDFDTIRDDPEFRQMTALMC